MPVTSSRYPQKKKERRIRVAHTAQEVSRRRTRFTYSTTSRLLLDIATFLNATTNERDADIYM